MVVETLDITEGMASGDANALASLAIKVAKEGVTFVEVGSWKGHSASVLARVIKERGGHLYCVDHWKGNKGLGNYLTAQNRNIYQVFEHNLKALNLWEYITPMIMDSLSASKEFADKSIDFLFLDADHRYHQFMQDLKAWMPKVKGIICGHDCEGYYSTFIPEQKELIDQNLTDDFIQPICHPGVVRGLFDYFGDDYSIVNDTKMWFKVKGEVWN